MEQYYKGIISYNFSKVHGFSRLLADYFHGDSLLKSFITLTRWYAR